MKTSEGWKKQRFSWLLRLNSLVYRFVDVCWPSIHWKRFEKTEFGRVFVCRWWFYNIPDWRNCVSIFWILCINIQSGSFIIRCRLDIGDIVCRITRLIWTEFTSALLIGTASLTEDVERGPNVFEVSIYPLNWHFAPNYCHYWKWLWRHRLFEQFAMIFCGEHLIHIGSVTTSCPKILITTTEEKMKSTFNWMYLLK